MATRRKSGGKSPDQKDDIRAIGVMFETLQSSVNALSEGLTSFRVELKTELRAVEQRLSDRLTVVEQVVRKNSEDIRKNSEDIRKNSEDIRKNSEDIRLMKIEIAELRLRFDQRDTRYEELEGRVAAMEKRLGLPT